MVTYNAAILTVGFATLLLTFIMVVIMIVQIKK